MGTKKVESSQRRLMHLYIEAGTLLDGRFTGVSYYTQRLLSELVGLNKDLSVKAGVFAGDILGDNWKQLQTIRYTTLPLPRRIWFNLSRLLNLKSSAWLDHQSSVFWYPDFTLLPNVTERIKTVVTIHDLAFVHFPETISPRNLSYLRKFVPLAVERADHIITPSQSTKDDVIRKYDVSPSKITVINPGIETVKTKPEASLIKQWGLQKQSYILFVGSLEPRKNIENIVRAYSLLPKKITQKHTLVLAGGDGWNNTEIQDSIRELRSAGFNIITTGYVSTDQRSSLYDNASCFLFPSLYEGFGIPILEAMAHQTPVVTSRNSSLTEAAGTAALYADPTNPEDISEKITTLLQNIALQEELKQSGLKQVRMFSWAKSVEKLEKVFAELASEPFDR